MMQRREEQQLEEEEIRQLQGEINMLKEYKERLSSLQAEADELAYRGPVQLASAKALIDLAAPLATLERGVVEALKQVKVLIVHGSADTLCALEDSERLGREIGGEVAVVEGGSHGVFADVTERRAVAARAVGEFVGAPP